VDKKMNYTCYILGNDSLTIQCAEILLAHNYQILAVISSAPVVQDWAAQRSIQLFSSFPKNQESLAPCDYLFSIVNWQILPEWVLKLPRYFAINYHDSPLPKYAGVHATSWAILNNEKQHGITWHVMEKQVDAGDILKQVIFPVDKKETALSLNLKCYQTAITAFSELVEDLARNTQVRIPQDLNQRTYFGIHQKPSGNGWVNWNDTAENIERLFRALKLGDYTNRLSILKFTIKNELYLIDELQVLRKKSAQTPGTIVKLSSKGLEIATRTYNIRILRFKTMDGNLYNNKILTEQNYLLGFCLSSPTINSQEVYQQLSADISKYEHFWVKELEQKVPTTLPFFD
jgi:methionyl-tRNA formyltransferase